MMAGVIVGIAMMGMGVGAIGILVAGPAADRFSRRVLITLSYGLPAVLVLILFRLGAVVLSGVAMAIGAKPRINNFRG